MNKAQALLKAIDQAESTAGTNRGNHAVVD
jgi:hypothetical protein